MPDGPLAVPRLSFTWSPISTIGPPFEIPTPKILASPVELVLIAFAVLPLIVLFWTVNELVSTEIFERADNRRDSGAEYVRHIVRDERIGDRSSSARPDDAALRPDVGRGRGVL